MKYQSEIQLGAKDPVLEFLVKDSFITWRNFEKARFIKSISSF